MKKGLALLFAAVLLAGCGGSKEKVTKTCTMEEEGLSASLVMEATGDTLTKASLNLGATFDALGIDKESYSSITEDQKSQFLDTMETMLLEELDMSKDDGYDVESKLTDNGFEMNVSAEASIFEQTFNATSVDEMVTSLEKEGYTCKQAYDLTAMWDFYFTYLITKHCC